MDKMNISCLSHDDCCGCGSCALVCPKHCIEMRCNDEGFPYPFVDENRCVSCGLCVKRCPVLERKQNFVKTEQKPLQKAFVFQDRDFSSLAQSTSGGAFACLARWILARGGVVFGAAYDEKLNVRHIAVESLDELNKLQGSKYVASDLGETYSLAKTLLVSGRRVLFSGTACQIAGLKSFLGKDNELLLTVDIVCHGTPSRKLFSKYVEWLGKRNGSVIEWFEFRAKRFAGWNLVGAYGIKGKTKVINPYCDPYYAAFLRGDTYRKSCYSCKFANLDRPGDFTLGDFWGYFKLKDKMNVDHKRGVSLFLANTSKAMVVKQELENLANIISVDVDTACAGNGNLYHPTEFKPIRNAIYKHIDEPFDVLQKKFLYHESKLGFVIRRLRRRLLSQKTRDRLKKILGK